MVMERAGRGAEYPLEALTPGIWAEPFFAVQVAHPAGCWVSLVPSSQNARSTTRWTWQPRTSISKSAWKNGLCSWLGPPERHCPVTKDLSKEPLNPGAPWPLTRGDQSVIGTLPTGRLTHLCSSGSSHPSWHSQWQSRKVSTWPFAAEAPSSRARTRPSLLLARIRRTLGSLDSSLARRSFRCSGEASGTMRDTHPKPGPSCSPKKTKQTEASFALPPGTLAPHPEPRLEATRRPGETGGEEFQNHPTPKMGDVNADISQ